MNVNTNVSFFSVTPSEGFKYVSAFFIRTSLRKLLYDLFKSIVVPSASAPVLPLISVYVPAVLAISISFEDTTKSVVVVVALLVAPAVFTFFMIVTFGFTKHLSVGSL